jgi:deoxyribonuclease IV
MPRLLGCHVSCAGGLHKALANAKRLKINAAQIHATPPLRWNTKALSTGAELAFGENFQGSGIRAFFLHAIYLINLASQDKQKFHLSKLSLLNTLDICERIGASGVIFHVGSCVGHSSEKAGMTRAIQGINWVLEHAPGSARLIMEVSAGSGQVIGDRLDELAAIFQKVVQPERVGFALDTQHLWASGYDLKNGLEDFIRQLERTLHLKKVWAIHLNDSKTELGSRCDRHANLGQGTIGKDVLRKVINHPKLKKIPFILETPGLATPQGARQELALLKALAAD